MKYWFENDSLYLSTVSEGILTVIDGDTSYIANFPMGSFIWGNALMKTFGKFGRIE